MTEPFLHVKDDTLYREQKAHNPVTTPFCTSLFNRKNALKPDRKNRRHKTFD